jgi:hypothetical protein
MSARAVPLVGAALARVTRPDCEALARLALDAPTPAAARAAVADRTGT